MTSAYSEKPLRNRRKLNLKSSERGRHHVIVRQTVHSECQKFKWPVLYLVLKDSAGKTELKRYQPLLEYYADHSAMSYRWKKNAARGVGLLIDYSMAIARSPEFAIWKNAGVLERKVFRGLARALVHGTMSLNDCGRVEDSTRLYWRGHGKRQAGVLLSALTLHFRWMRNESGAIEWVRATSTTDLDQHPVVAFNLATEHLIRRQGSLLGHLKGMKREPAHSVPGIVKRSSVPIGAVPSFPPKYVGPFLYHGFEGADGERDETAETLAHLIFGLGLRKSEGFHLFPSDIQFVGDYPWIFFHHPQHGKVGDGRGGLTSREEYLQRFGLLPRNVDEGRNKAGWKGMEGDEDGTPGYWLPISHLRNRTALLLKRYLFVTRPAIMARRPRSLGDHPFLFVSSGRTANANGGEPGDPYTMEAFDATWERAVDYTGKRFDDPVMAQMTKPSGNTPHGARHFFGRFLLSTGVEGPVIKRCMHHKTLEAHKAYTRLTPSELNAILQKAGERRVEHEPFQNLRDEFLSQFQHASRSNV
ncbi:tyrosine-type recombinase/integrase [Rhizobium phaseoli]|uniref:tyrosine-type recombinase/integrase n=1 Tax=Rhizobium phaseoli TaxID=396 RepID=UPI0002D5E537|nr:tyrosine-type recombinase/integrase [Rhizobium phaseoli]KKZ88538.1 integrase [Rhizobium phaseoli Ch24-10]